MEINKSILDIQNAHLHDFVFHYNVFTLTWNAVPRELYLEYWKDYKIEGVLRSKDIETLIALLNKYKGDVEEINRKTK
jgi:hypothetical protein